VVPLLHHDQQHDQSALSCGSADVLLGAPMTCLGYTRQREERLAYLVSVSAVQLYSSDLVPDESSPMISFRGCWFTAILCNQTVPPP
jgi:hypothetical protein